MENVGAIVRQHRGLARWLAVGCWVLAAGLLPAQPAAARTARPLFFSHLQMAQGLSHGDALAVLQDRQGFVWVATESGLNRFDGREVRVYRRGGPGSEGLDADFINGMVEDANGDLWLATLGGGLVRWERRTDRFTAFRHDEARPDSLAADALLSVWAAPDGDIWVGTENAGLDRFNPRTGKFQHFRANKADAAALPNGAVFVLAAGDQERLWVGTDGGLALLDRATGRVLRRYDRTTQPALPDDQIRALHVERDGVLWIGTLKGGLAQLSADGEQVRAFASDPAVPGSLASPFVRAILRDTEGRLWVGTANGLNLLQAEGTFQQYVYRPEDPRGLPDSFIMSLYQDPSGLLWVGTRSGGVSRWNPRSWQMGHFRPALANGLPIAAFAEGRTADETLVGTLGGGLLGVDFSTGAERTLLDTKRGLTDDRVMSLLRDRQDRLWIGTFTGGLVRQDANGKLKVFRGAKGSPGALPADGVMSLFEDRSGNVWVGTFGGGACRFLENEKFDCSTDTGPIGQRLSDTRATALAEDRQGRIWIGTPGGGLNLLDPLTRQVRIFRRQGPRAQRAGLSDDRIYALHVARDGVLWVGTAAGGLMRVVPPNISLSLETSILPV